MFDSHVLDTERRELRRGHTVVSVQPQVFDLLEYLIRNRGHVVSRDDLLDAIWGGRIVSESTLATRINAARSAIGDDGESQRLRARLTGAEHRPHAQQLYCARAKLKRVRLL